MSSQISTCKSLYMYLKLNFDSCCRFSGSFFLDQIQVAEKTSRIGVDIA